MKDQWTRRGYCLSIEATERLRRLAIALYRGRGEKRKSELIERMIWCAKIENGKLAFDPDLDYQHGNEIELPKELEDAA